MYQEPTRRLADLSQRCHVRKFACLLARPLSLRFNQEEFWDGLYSVPKLLLVAVFPSSGALFERRVALGSAREPAFGPPGRSSAGFRRLSWRAQLHQKRRNYPMDPYGRQPPLVVTTLPRQPKVRNT